MTSETHQKLASSVAGRSKQPESAAYPSSPNLLLTQAARICCLPKQPRKAAFLLLLASCLDFGCPDLYPGTGQRLKRFSLNCLSSRKVLNGKPHGWDSTAERLIRDNLTSQVDQETPRYAFESSRAHGSIVGEKHTAVYQ